MSKERQILNRDQKGAIAAAIKKTQNSRSIPKLPTLKFLENENKKLTSSA